MKLVIDVRMVNNSGIGTYIKNIVPGIIQAFPDTVLLGNPAELSAFEWAQKCTVIPFTDGIYSIKGQLRYPLVVPRCDVLWTPHFNAPLLPVKAKKRIVSIHDAFHLSNVAQIPLLQKLYARLLLKNAFNRSAKVFTISQFTQKELVRLLNVKTAKITIIPLGVNRLFFEAPAPALPHLPEKHILYVGNVKPHKNLITLLKAYNRLPQDIKATYKLIILGKKEGFINADRGLYGYLKQHNLEDNVIFTGYLEDKDVPALYRHSALFVLPSLYEGFGLPILEALAAGTRVLSSNAASLPEVGGNVVTYFDPLDEKTLSQLIQATLLQPTHLNKEAINSLLNNFSWQKTIDRYITEFKELQKHLP